MERQTTFVEEGLATTARALGFATRVVGEPASTLWGRMTEEGSSVDILKRQAAKMLMMRLDKIKNRSARRRMRLA